MPASVKRKAPIFNEYTIDELSRRLDKSIGYLNQMAEGTKPITATFRFNACAILNRPEAELFGPQEEQS